MYMGTLREAPVRNFGGQSRDRSGVSSEATQDFQTLPHWCRRSKTKAPLEGICRTSLPPLIPTSLGKYCTQQKQTMRDFPLVFDMCAKGSGNSSPVETSRRTLPLFPRWKSLHGINRAPPRRPVPCHQAPGKTKHQGCPAKNLSINSSLTARELLRASGLSTLSKCDRCLYCRRGRTHA